VLISPPEVTHLRTHPVACVVLVDTTPLAAASHLEHPGPFVARVEAPLAVVSPPATPTDRCVRFATAMVMLLWTATTSSMKLTLVNRPLRPRLISLPPPAAALIRTGTLIREPLTI
jgi:hypothetical protein